MSVKISGNANQVDFRATLEDFKKAFSLTEQGEFVHSVDKTKGEFYVNASGKLSSANIHGGKGSVTSSVSNRALRQALLDALTNAGVSGDFLGEVRQTLLGDPESALSRKAVKGIFVKLAEREINVPNPSGNAMKSVKCAFAGVQKRADFAQTNLTTPVSSVGMRQIGADGFEVIGSGRGKIGGKDAQAIDGAIRSADKALNDLGALLMKSRDVKAFKKAFSTARTAQLELAGTIKNANAKGFEMQLGALMVRAFKRAQTLETLLGKLTSGSTRSATMTELRNALNGKDNSKIADVLDSKFEQGIADLNDLNKLALPTVLTDESQDGAYGKFLALLSGELPESETELKDLAEMMEGLEKQVRPKLGGLSEKNMDATTLFLYDLADRIGEVRIELNAKIALCEQVDKIFGPLAIIKGMDGASPCGQAWNTLNELCTAIKQAIVRGDADGWKGVHTSARECLRELKDRYGAITVDMYSKLSNEKQVEFDGFVKKTCSQLPHFVSLLQRMPKVSAEDAVRIIDGSSNIADYVMTLAMGLKPDDIAAKASVSPIEVLGEGAASQAFLCEDENGKKSVFKPELTSFYGIEFGVVGHHSQAGVDGFATATAVNMATKDIAMVGGTPVGKVIVDTKVGHVNGQYGMLMEYAPGISMNKLLEQMERPDLSQAESDQITLGEGGATLGKIRNLDQAEKQKLLAEIAQQMNRLQWLDAITGQLDRHGGNYLLYVSPDLQTVEVKGIDNDAAFPTSLTTPGEYTFSTREYEGFLESAKEYFKGDGEAFNATVKGLLADKAITNQDGGLKISFNNLPPAFKLAFVNVTGIKNPSLPTYIDEQMYDLIRHFNTDGGRKEFTDILMRRNLSGEQIEAAVARLRYLADKINFCRFMGEEGWLKQMKDLMEGPPEEVSSNEVESDETSAGLSRYVRSDYFLQGAMDLFFRKGAEFGVVQQPPAIENPFIREENANQLVGEENVNPFEEPDVNPYKKDSSKEENWIFEVDGQAEKTDLSGAEKKYSNAEWDRKLAK